MGKKNILTFTLLFTIYTILYSANVTKNKLRNDIIFLENKGQILDFNNQPRPDVLYMLRGQGVNVFVGKGQLHYQFSHRAVTGDNANIQSKRIVGTSRDLSTSGNHLNQAYDLFKQRDTSPQTYETYRIDLSLVGMNPDATVESLEQSTYYENYYNVPGHYQDGILNVHGYGRIVMHNVYPHIDWVLYSKDGKLKHEFVLHPGARYEDIKLRIQGATNMLVNAAGELEITTPLGNITEDKPTILGGNGVSGNFVLNKLADLDYSISYQLENLPTDFKEDIVIDPGVVWSTFYGGEGVDLGITITETKNNCVAGGGITGSKTTMYQKGFQSSGKGGDDWFVFKMDDFGNRLWGTYFGGTGNEELNAIKSDKNGNIICAGGTYSAGLGYKGYDTSYGGSNIQDGIVVMFSDSGYRVWATYVGGPSTEFVSVIDTLVDGKILVAGSTYSTTDIATSGAYQTTKNATQDGFVVLLDKSAKRIWGTYFGSDNDDYVMAICSDTKYFYLGGGTYSTTGIAYNGFQNTTGGNLDAYITKFDTSGKLIWSSYLGGTGFEFFKSLAIDKDNVYGTGRTNGNGMSKGTVFQSGYRGGANDGFLSKISKSGNLIWSTYIGSTGYEDGRSVIVDNKNNIWVFCYWGGNGLGYNGYFDIPTGSSSMATYMISFDTLCNRNYATHYYGFLGYPSSGNLLYEPNCMSGGSSKYLYTISSDYAGLSVTVRATYQPNYNANTDGFLVKWSINNFSKPYITNTTPICQNSKLNVVYLQYGVGRGSTAKTYLELSDTNGKFNTNTKIIYTRSDTLSKYDSIFYTIPYTVKPGKHYRIRARMVYPPDTSEASLPFEIHPGPTGKILTPSSIFFCERDSLKLELDTVGKNKIRWYRINVPTANAGDTNQVYYAKQDGKHYVVLTNQLGCTYTTNNISLIMNARPWAGFVPDKTQSCFLNNQFSWTDTSKAASGDNIVQRGWDFGDGNTSTSINPTFSYVNPGTYLVKYGLLTSKGCKDSAFQTVEVDPTPVAKIHLSQHQSCIFNNKVDFVDSTILPNVSGAKGSWIRLWRRNNNFLDTSKTFTYSFISTGNHLIFLKVQTDKGCLDSATDNVQLFSSPVAIITSNKTEFCDGDSAKFTATDNPVWTYQWRNNKAIVGSNQKTYVTRIAGNYSVKVTTPDGCDTVSNGISIVVNPLPNPNLGPDQTLPNNGNTTLNPGTFSQYKWSTGAVSSTLIVDKFNLDTGKNTIWVKVTDGKGCQASDTVVITLQPVNGVQQTIAGGWKIYPNPVESTLVVEGIGTANYRLTDVTGRLISQGTFVQTVTLDVFNLSKGTYLLTLVVDGERYEVKVVK